MFLQRDTLECAVISDDPCGSNDVLRELGGSNKKALQRNRSIKQKLSEIGKKRRKELSRMKKGYAEAEKEQEGESYMSGGH